MDTTNRQFLVKCPKNLFPLQGTWFHQAAPLWGRKPKWNDSVPPHSTHWISSSKRKSQQHSTSSFCFVNSSMPPKTPHLPPSSQWQNFSLFPEFSFPHPSSTCCIRCSQEQRKWPQSGNKETNPPPALLYLTVGRRMLHWLYCLVMKPSS